MSFIRFNRREKADARDISIDELKPPDATAQHAGLYFSVTRRKKKYFRTQ